MGLSKKRKERNTWPAWGVLLAFSPLGKSNKKNKIPKKQKAAPAWGPCFLVIFFCLQKIKKQTKLRLPGGFCLGFIFLMLVLSRSGLAWGEKWVPAFLLQPRVVQAPLRDQLS